MRATRAAGRSRETVPARGAGDEAIDGVEVRRVVVDAGAIERERHSALADSRGQRGERRACDR